MLQVACKIFVERSLNRMQHVAVLPQRNSYRLPIGFLLTCLFPVYVYFICLFLYLFPVYVYFICLFLYLLPVYVYFICLLSISLFVSCLCLFFCQLSISLFVSCLCLFYLSISLFVSCLCLFAVSSKVKNCS